MNTIKLLKNDDIDIGLICNTELPKGIVYSPVKEIHDVFVASPEYLDNFYERNGNALDDVIMDELSPHIKGNIIPLLGASKRAGKNTSSDSLYNDSDSAADNPTDSSLPNHSNITTTDILENSNLMVLEEANVTRTHVDEYLRSQGISCSRYLKSTTWISSSTSPPSAWALPAWYVNSHMNNSHPVL